MLSVVVMGKILTKSTSTRVGVRPAVLVVVVSVLWAVLVLSSLFVWPNPHVSWITTAEITDLSLPVCVLLMTFCGLNAMLRYF